MRYILVIYFYHDEWQIIFISFQYHKKVQPSRDTTTASNPFEKQQTLIVHTFFKIWS